MLINKVKQFFIDTYYAARYKTWCVYDPADIVILYVGRRKQCYKVQSESYGGVIVIPVFALKNKKPHTKN